MKKNNILTILTFTALLGIMGCGSTGDSTNVPDAQNSAEMGDVYNDGASNNNEEASPVSQNPIDAYSPNEQTYTEPSVEDEELTLRDQLLSSSTIAPNIFSSSSQSNSLVRPISSSSKASQPSNSIVDGRDGKIYRITSIGSQIWMAENMRYETTSSLCYQSESECAKYGRLYTWADAMNVCPNGWHLPSEGDWEVLFSVVGGHNLAGAMLTDAEWSVDSGDPLSFSALPGGYYSNGTYNHVGDYATFWSSTDYSSYNGNYWMLTAGAVYLNNKPKSDGMSVRCLMND